MQVNITKAFDMPRQNIHSISRERNIGLHSNLTELMIYENPTKSVLLVQKRF